MREGRREGGRGGRQREKRERESRPSQSCVHIVHVSQFVQGSLSSPNFPQFFTTTMAKRRATVEKECWSRQCFWEKQDGHGDSHFCKFCWPVIEDPLSAEDFAEKTKFTKPGYAFKGCCNNSTGTAPMRNHMQDFVYKCDIGVPGAEFHELPAGVPKKTRKQAHQEKQEHTPTTQTDGSQVRREWCIDVCWTTSAL